MIQKKNASGDLSKSKPHTSSNSKTLFYTNMNKRMAKIVYESIELEENFFCNEFTIL
jgi:hypothetical protein